MKHRIEVDFVDLGHRPQVAGNEGVGLHILLALKLIDVARLEGALALTDIERRVLSHCALVDAKYGNFAHVGVHDDLEDMSENMLAGIRLRMEFLAFGTGGS